MAKTKRKRIIKKKTKLLLIGYAKRAIVIGLIIGAIVYSIINIAENVMLKRDNVSLQGLYTEYRDAYEEANTEFVTEYNYWLERYQDLRSSYLELLQYVREEDMDYEVFTITAYSPDDEKQGTNSITSIGFDIRKEYSKYINICAVDPDVIELGSIVLVRSDWDNNGLTYDRIFIAGDIGGAVIGKHIDIFLKTKEGAVAFGVKALPVKILQEKDKKG